MDTTDKARATPELLERWKKNGHKPLVHRDLGWLSRAVAQAMSEYVAGIVAPLRKRIEELEARTLEKSYRGIWREADSYPSGSLCTHDGSLWLAKELSCRVRPGTSAKWVLITKRGKDAR